MTDVQKATYEFQARIALIAQNIGETPCVHEMARVAIDVADKFDVEMVYDREGNFTFRNPNEGVPR